MAGNKKSRSFRKGFVLGGLAGAAAMLWNAPQSGGRTREQALELIESALFKVLDIPVFPDGVRTAPTANSAPAPRIEPAPAKPEPTLGADIVIDGPRPVELSA